MTKSIAKVVVGLPVEGPFDYFVEEPLREEISVGTRVLVPFGPRRIAGYVTGLASRSRYKSPKAVLSVLDGSPAVDRNILNLARDFSRYYGCSVGEALDTAMPTALRQRKKISISYPRMKSGSRKKVGQENLCHDPGLDQAWPFILDKIQAALVEGGSVIFLVPEVAMIPEVQKRITDNLDVPCAVLDKRITAKVELERWIRVRQGENRLVIGTRSAIFAPVWDLGLIILFEEENQAYKQEQSPFYHARQVAKMRQKREGADILYVSAAPSVETWYETSRKKNGIINFPVRDSVSMQVIDLSNYKPRQRSSVAYPMMNSVQDTVMAGNRVLLFFNKKGFSAKTSCNECGHVLKCERCDVNLSYLYSRKKLVCPMCNSSRDLPKICPQCRSSYLRSVGGGVEKLESDMARVLPGVKTATFDSDTEKVPDGAQLVIATQAVLRQMRKISPCMTGVLNIDGESSRMDYRASRRVFSILVQLKQMTREKVIVQSYRPHDHGLQAAIKDDFEGFYKQEIRFRRQLGFPPFQHLIAVTLRASDEDAVFDQAKDLFARLSNLINKGEEILEPQPDFIPKLRGKYRYTIMLKSKNVPRALNGIKGCLKAFRKKRGTIITVNVDP